MELKNKRILVTGADGFIGSHLVEALVQKGAQVKALYYYNAFNRWGWLEDIDCIDEIQAVPGDIRDSHLVRTISKDIDIIFNLAALIAIPYSYTAPASYVDTNISGTLNICQAAMENGCKRIIHTSTSEVYGTAQYVPIDEKHPLHPQSPYSASKIGADALTMSFYYTYNLPLITARPFNTYGPRQSARAVIPTIITQIAAGKKQIKTGNLTPTRDFNYVKDTVNGLILLAECDQAIGETVNIGSNDEISIEDLTILIKKLMDSDALIVKENQRIRPDKSEVDRLRCDNTKIKTLVNYRPVFSLEKGLQNTIHWFKKNLAKYKVNIYNV